MSKRSAFSQKCEQRHWRLRHDQVETERQQKRMQKCQRKVTTRHSADVLAAHDDGDGEPDSERDVDLDTERDL